jgi:hypothetical protein
VLGEQLGFGEGHTARGSTDGQAEARAWHEARARKRLLRREPRQFVGPGQLGVRRRAARIRQVLHLRRQLGSRAAGFERGHASQRTFTAQQALEGRWRVVTERRDDADAGDGDACARRAHRLCVIQRGRAR